MLIEKGAVVDEKSKDGTTALMNAAQQGHNEIARLLIEKGADVNAKTDSGTTPLMWAAMTHHGDTAELLINNGVDVGVAIAGLEALTVKYPDSASYYKDGIKLIK